MPSLPPRPTTRPCRRPRRDSERPRSRSRCCSARAVGTTTSGSRSAGRAQRSPRCSCSNPPERVTQLALPANTSPRSTSTAGELHTPPQPVAGPPPSGSKFHRRAPMLGIERDDAGARPRAVVAVVTDDDRAVDDDRGRLDLGLVVVATRRVQLVLPAQLAVGHASVRTPSCPMRSRRAVRRPRRQWRPTTTICPEYTFFCGGARNDQRMPNRRRATTRRTCPTSRRRTRCRRRSRVSP